MALAACSLIGGLLVLIWSADKLVDGAANTARYMGIPPILIGMVIIGFGTSAPEMVVSVFAALQGNPGLALGNGYGSNISNIGLIIGVVAILKPMTVARQVIRRELPVLITISILALLPMLDDELSRLDGILLVIAFFVVMGWSIYQTLKKHDAPLIEEGHTEESSMSLKWAVFSLLYGLVLLMVSSRALVWGAVEIAHSLGISDLVIGLTVVAIGTSLPELASSIVAVRKGKHDIALGNVVGSNFFNTLMVVGLAAWIAPLKVDPIFIWRDWVIMSCFTVGLFIMAILRSKNGIGTITRPQGALLLASYIAYMGYVGISSL